jgi:hypothetical protein
MRAATAIVGAIAVASILIALAFVFSGGDDSEATVTRTVTEEIVSAPKPTAHEESSVEEPPAEEEGGAAFGGLQQCGGGEFSVENVSCEIGTQVRSGYEQGARGEILAEDQESGETITMSCSGTAPTECKGPGGARVFFGG